MGTIAYLQFRQIVGGRKIWLVGLFLALPILLTVVIQSSGGFVGSDAVQRAAFFLFIIYTQLIGVLLSLLYGTAILSGELEAKTLTYLFTRPLPKWKVISSKYLAVIGTLAGPAVGGVLTSWLILGQPGGMRLILGQAIATLGAIVAFTAIFTAMGVIVQKRPIVVGVIYALVFEFFVSTIPASFSKMTVTHYLRSIVVRMSELGGLSEAGGVTATALTPALFCVTGVAVAALGLASLIATTREYVVADQA